MKRQSAHLQTSLIFLGVITAFTLILLSCSSSEASLTTGTVTDIDGNEYRTVKIGAQWWMAENLRVTKYRNGESIPHITDGKEWCDLTTGAYCAYDNDSSNIPTYGLLYNWYAAVDSQGICPEGWHVPSDKEWMELEMYLGMKKSDRDLYGMRGSDEGGKVKEAGTTHWKDPNTGATNETGLTVLPSGGRTSNPAYGGDFFYQGEAESIWSSDEYSDSQGLFREFWYDESRIDRKYYSKGNGFTIRCIKD